MVSNSLLIARFLLVSSLLFWHNRARTFKKQNSGDEFLKRAYFRELIRKADFII